MKRNQITVPAAAVALLSALAFPGSVRAQSADALIDKLVEKGILTVKEANDLRQETDKDFTKAYSLKSGMPDWVSAVKFNGDFRGRMEHFTTDNPNNTDRTRYRYRLRFGTTVTMFDDFEVGFRLTSADPVFGSGGTLLGGNPVSGNTTLQDGSARKGVFIDQAYAKWTPIHNGTWNLAGTIGKMTSPFDASNMVFDYDYMPEGASIQGGYHINDQHSLALNLGAFVLDEENQPAPPAATPPGNPGNLSAGHDPFYAGAQLLWNAKWTPKIETTLGVAGYAINATENLSNGLVANVNDGNTRDAFGNLMYHYNPIVGQAALTYKLESFPWYKGEFPIRWMGEYMRNPAAPSQNTGYRAGVIFGKAGKRGQWDIGYRYQRLEADAWYEEFVDDDNSGYYQEGRVGSGFTAASRTGGAPFGSGIRGGTNVKGHLITANYSLYDSLTLSLLFYVNDLVVPSPAASQSSANHFLFDLNWKF